MRRKYLALAMTWAMLIVVLRLTVLAEPNYVAVSVTATATTSILEVHTRTVTLVNDGANEVYFRLFTDVDTFAAATTAAAQIKAGESLEYTLDLDSPDSEFGAARPSYYKLLSSVCDTAETATLRVYSK
jgi:hypothetical protein